MAEMQADCPRCHAQKFGFDVTQSNQLKRIEHGWIRFFEFYSVCRNCHQGTIFVVRQKEFEDKDKIDKDPLGFKDSLTNHFEVRGYISLKDQAQVDPPEHLPEEIENAFREGATCLAVQCWNAAGVMFRMCVDHATRALLPPMVDGEAQPTGLNNKVRRDLGLRLPWLFDNGILPESLRDLSACIHQDGNEGAHQGTLGEPEASDLLEFTTLLLERLYTEPEKLRIAQERRDDRRKKAET